MRPTTILLAAALFAAPVQAAAQANDAAEVEAPDTQRGQGNSKLGLLGLLGLAGLLGLIKREPDIHVDARRDTQG